MTKATNSATKNAAKASVTPTSAPSEIRKPTRLDQLQELIARESGATIAEMCQATGWQQHSVRGALAGALKKRGLQIRSEKIDGLRRYHADTAE
ncbi:MAG: DUF3489 domain-containing protein [Caenibius sp.]